MTKRLPPGPECNGHKSEREKMLESYVKELRADLFGLLPHDLQSIFFDKDLPNGETIHQSAWKSRVLDEVIAKAAILPRDAQEDDSGNRAYCPLCGAGGTSAYHQGFAYPKGLRGHLDSTTHQCVFFKHAFKEAQDYWRECFSEENAKKREDKLQEIAQRKKNERVYKINPTQEPQFLDDIIYGKCRTPESLVFAEARLRDLEFSIQDEGNIRSYTKDYGSYILFADPRSEGGIQFALYLKNKFKGTFTLQDRWKHNLKKKLDNFFEKRLPTVLNCKKEQDPAKVELSV